MLYACYCIIMKNLMSAKDKSQLMSACQIFCLSLKGSVKYDQ